MSEKEIRIVGSFKDDITPKLKKLNDEITAINKKFEDLQKKLRPLAKSMGTLAAASERLTRSLKDQGNQIKQNTDLLNNYTKDAKGLSSIRPPRVTPPPPGRPPTPPSAPAPARPSPSGGGGGGGGGGGRRSGLNLGGIDWGRGLGGFGPGEAFAFSLQYSLSNVIMNAFTQGFQLFMASITTPLTYFAEGLVERVEDEMSDVRTAGGIFAVSQRMDEPLFKTLKEAESQTRETNRYLAELAGALPGSTQEYVQVSKQIADGVYTLVAQDKENSIVLAERIAAENGQLIRKTNENQTLRDVGKTLIGELTKTTVLAGLGGKQTGAHSLPALTERMLTEEKVTMGMFQRYAAIFKDPLLKGTLERNIDKISATPASTAARYEALLKTFREIVTPSLVRRYQKTVAGVIEAFRTSFLDPEVGLFGLGRPLQQTAIVYDDFGNMVIKAGVIVRDNLSVFDYLRDIFYDLSWVIMPVVDAASLLFLPFEELGRRLGDIRKSSMMFLSHFENYRQYLVEMAEDMKGDTQNKFLSTVGIRASLATFNNALFNAGIIAGQEADRIGRAMIDTKTDYPDFREILLTQIDQYLNSELAFKQGGMVGGVLGTLLKMIAEIIKGFLEPLKDSSFAKGFVDEFTASGGVQAIKDIFGGIFTLLGKLLWETVKTFPKETAIIGFVTILLPAIASALMISILGAIPQIIGKFMPGAMKMPSGGFRRTPKPPRTPPTGAFSPPPPSPPGWAGKTVDVKPTPVTPSSSATKGGVTGLFQTLARGVQKAFPTISKGVGGIFNAIRGATQTVVKNPGKVIGGIASGLFAISDFGNRMKEGQGLAKSAGGSLGGLAGGIAGAKAGGVAGGIIGSFIGPLGTLIGGVIGSLIGGAIGYLAGGKLGEMLPGLYQTFMGTYLKILETVIRGIVFAIGLSIGLLVRGISSIPGIVTGLYNSLVSGLGYVLQSLKTFVVNLFNEETRNQMIQGFKTGLSNLVSLVTSELTGFGRRVWQAFRGGYERGRREQPLDLNPRNNLPGAEPQYKGSFGTDSFMPLPRAIATEIKHKPPGSELVIANDSELIIPTKAAYSGSGDIGVIVNPLQGINTKTSSVIQYLNLVRSQINTSGNQTVSSISNARTEQTGVMRQVNSSINTGTIDVVSTLRQVLAYLSALVGSFTGTMDVRVVNTPTVNMSMGAYGPIGGSVGNFPKTSGFGQRWGRLHAGNDYGMPVGTRLAIGGPGTVLRSGYWGGYGLAMDIGGPGGMVYRFAHLSRFLAPPGAMLPPGVPFALSGNTGRSTGPHLHFEARPGGGGPVNPDPYAGIIRANYKGMGLSSIMDATKNELSNMPYGSNLVVGNSSELIMRPNQVGNLVESATRAGVEGSRNVTITGLNININGANKSGKELANEIASHILGAIESANYTEIYT